LIRLPLFLLHVYTLGEFEQTIAFPRELEELKGEQLNVERFEPSTSNSSNFLTETPNENGRCSIHIAQ